MTDTTPNSLNEVLDAPEPENNYTLYTKNAVYAFSFFGSVIFGAAMLTKNLRTIGKTKAIAMVWMISVGYFIAEILVSIYIKTQTSSSLTFLFNIAGGMILSRVLYPRYIPDTVQFSKRPIWMPLIILLVIVVLFIFANVYSWQ